MDFINSVEFLKKFHDEKNKTEIPPQSHPIKKTTTTSPVSINKILETIVPVWKSSNSFDTEDQNANDRLTIEQLNKRILSLEQQVKYLLQKIKVIEQ